MRVRLLPGASLVAAAVVLIGTPAAFAALTANSNLTQTVNPGALSTSILDSGGSAVGSPSFAMTATTASTATQTSTGVFGNNNQRITVENPGASNSGWTLALSATGSWSDGGSNTYPYNGATAADGQLTVNPSAGTLTPTFGTSTGISRGTSSTFVSGSVSSIELLNAGATSDDVWSGYLTGVGLSQTVPAGTSAANYTLVVTQTVATQ